MAATIKIKNSSTAGAAPTSSDLVQGELAVNVTDKRLYTENASGTIVELGTNPSVPVTFPDGSASAPSLTNDGDTNTGLFFPAADTVGIATGGTERLRLDSSGNLGLGVTPSAWLSTLKAFQVGTGSLFSTTTSQNTLVGANVYFNAAGNPLYIVSDYATYYQQYQGQHRWNIAASGTAGGTITPTQAMTLDASGNLGIGTTSPSTYGKFTVIAPDYSFGTFGTTDGTDVTVNIGSNSVTQGGYVNTVTNHPLIFGTNSTERARIDSSGNLLVGTTSASTSVAGVWIYNPSSSGRINITKTISGGAPAIANYYNGSYVGGVDYSNTATSLVTSSDIRLKKDVVNAGPASEKIDQIRIVSHGWKHDDEIVEFGVVAQELNLVAPQAVVAGDDGEEIEKTWGVDYSKLVPILIKAHQEQQALITSLTARITALEA